MITYCKHGAIVVEFLHIVREPLFGDGDQVAVGDRFTRMSVIQGQIDADLLPQTVPKVLHAHVEVVGERLSRLQSSHGTPNRNRLAILRTGHMLYKINIFFLMRFPI